MNLELDLRFGPAKCLNLGPDHWFRFEPVKFPTQFSAQKEGLGYFWTSNQSNNNPIFIKSLFRWPRFGLK